jgi:AcrR family transcriptional regulator
MSGMASSRVLRLPRDQRRAQLLLAAIDVLPSKGYHAAAMDDIADAAGVSKPVLYQHFGSKVDLYLAVLDASCERLTTEVEQALASTEDNAERVSATMDAYFDYVARATGEFRFVFESDLTDDRVQDRINAAQEEIADAVAGVIAEDTGLSRDQAKLLAISLVGLAQVSARYWLNAGPERLELTEAKQLASTLAWRGIAGFPRTG